MGFGVSNEGHLRWKAFRSHHVIDLSSVGSRIPSSSKINCEIHTDVQIDYFCSQHDVLCCRHNFSSQSQQYFSAASLLFFSEHGPQIVSMMDLQVEIL
jgi:hypothetical protein